MPKIVTRGRCLGHIWALAIYHLPNAPTGCWRGSSGDTVSCLGPHLQLTLLFGCVCRRQLDASKEHTKKTQNAAKGRVGQLDL